MAIPAAKNVLFISNGCNSPGVFLVSGDNSYSSIAMPNRVVNISLNQQLVRSSLPYQEPMAQVDWSTLSLESFWLPESSLSLYGVDEFMRLPLCSRQALSQVEFLHFIEAGLWLERLFMKRISASLWQGDQDSERMRYHLHELREEAGHTLMFMELHERSGLIRPASGFDRLRLANCLGTYAPFESLAFWIAVLVGEAVPDRVNHWVHKNRDGVCPAIYDLARVHMIDEARHIAHARQSVVARLAQTAGWSRRLLAPLISAVFRQFVRALYFPPQAIYLQAGLPAQTDWHAKVLACKARSDFVDENVCDIVTLLAQYGVALRWR